MLENITKQLTLAFESNGWDGVPMPGDDYWFTLTYREGGLTKEFRAHLALKR